MTEKHGAAWDWTIKQFIFFLFSTLRVPEERNYVWSSRPRRAATASWGSCWKACVPFKATWSTYRAVRASTASMSSSSKPLHGGTVSSKTSGSQRRVPEIFEQPRLLYPQHSKHCWVSTSDISLPQQPEHTCIATSWIFIESPTKQLFFSFPSSFALIGTSSATATSHCGRGWLTW